uniref:Uncharacterized protein n=1 Tax=Siphoviridae sp. cttnq1 TaxID=2826495 RepID=A0A8S5QYQ7_9CAUD|nr:MAG TPA: hypothetical protein [Siphoviridae sp. cttnq1]
MSASTVKRTDGSFNNFFCNDVRDEPVISS